MRPTLARLLDSRRQVYAASAVTLALGLFFLFVWSPLPWGWEGIDHYHDSAIRLASGLAFDTTDYPWGYPYYIAAFYAIFGSHAWIPLLAQALLNALVPWLLYHLVHPLAGQRVAVLSAVLVGVLSFNTVYVSTQSSDCVSTVIFLSGLVLVSRGIRGGGWWPLAAAGLMAGLAPQFRPNLILFPPIAAAGYVAARRVTRTAMMQMAVYLGVAGLALLPWIVRNYRLTETFVPTSTHGGLQLWYGTLQVGPYLESRAHNPRSAFESSAFDYTSIVDKPIIISGKYARCLARGGERVDLVYWTDRDPQHRRATPQPREHDRLSVEVAGQPAPTVFYYYFEAAFPEGDGEPATRFLTPLGGADTPLVAFVATDHLGDLDRHDDLLDIFDVVRLVRHLAWDEPLDRESLLDVDHNGRLDDQDVSEAVALLVPERPKAASIARPTILERGAGAAVIHLPDGSRLTVPRTWRGRQTDLAPEGEMASTLVSRWRSYASIAHPPERLQAGQCLGDRRGRRGRRSGRGTGQYRSGRWCWVLSVRCAQRKNHPRECRGAKNVSESHLSHGLPS